MGSKVSKEWILKWIIDPHAFRPDSRMPRFYGVTNNSDKEDWPKNYAEANAIAHYLFTKSTEPAGFVDPPAKTDPAKGKELFLQKGCLACHQHRPYQPDEVQPADQDSANKDYKPDAAADLRSQELPGLGPRRRHGQLRPQPVEHRRQVPVASPRGSSGWRTGSRPRRSTIPRA